MPGQRHDSIGVEPLILDVAFGALLADKASDNNWLRAELNDRGAIAVIPPKADRKTAVVRRRSGMRVRKQSKQRLSLCRDN